MSSRRKGEPVELMDIIIPGSGPGEVVVDITARGVCHTDLTYREGETPARSTVSAGARRIIAVDAESIYSNSIGPANSAPPRR